MSNIYLSIIFTFHFAAERDITKKAEIFHIEVNNVISYIRGGLVVLNL